MKFLFGFITGILTALAAAVLSYESAHRELK